MSKYFIDRPKLAWVVAIFLSLAGLLVIPLLPVSQFPDVAPPQISIEATYPGASAQTVLESVVSVIEEELNGANHLLYYESTSSASGSATIQVTFAPGTDPDLAQVDVQNRLKQAEARLPQPVQSQGLHVEQTSANFLLMYSLSYKPGTENKDRVRLAEYAARSINNDIRRVPGVGKVQYFASDAAMRVWIDPQKLLGVGLSVADVTAAIAAQNVQVSAGSFGGMPTNDQELTAAIVVKGTLDTPEEFGQIVLRAHPDGSSVRLADVARIEIGLQNYSFDTFISGDISATAAVQLRPGANALATAHAVKARLDELAGDLPADMQVAVNYDGSRFVDAAIGKVLATLAEAVVLVFLVILLFLQNVRYTLVPTIVVPVCLLATLAVMYALGFSVNMMTMFGMVLAIGILVDDAIVVVENVERIMAEEGLSPRAATVKAMQQVSGAIIGITLVLAAVFMPLAFMSGSVGVIYQQFSVSLAVSILFSGFLALTFTPALCATLLKPIKPAHAGQPGQHGGDPHAVQRRGFYGWFNRLFARTTSRFTSLTARLVKRTGRMMIVYLALTLALAWAYLRLPESFVPVEDQAHYIIDVQLPPGATDERTREVIKEIDAYLLPRESTQGTLSILGFSFSGTGSNSSLIFPLMTDWAARNAQQHPSEEVAAFNRYFSAMPHATVMAVDPPAIDGLGNAGGFALRLQDRSGLGRAALLAARDDMLKQANASPVFAYASMEGLNDAPQVRLHIDRARAEALGVTFDTINTAISAAYGSATINDYSNAGRQQRVVVQADAQYRSTPDRMLDLHVPNASGGQVPLRAFTRIEWETGPVQVDRYNGYPTIKIAGDAAPGFSTGQAMAALENIAATLPAGIGYEWTGLSYQEKLAGSQAPMLLGLAILVVFLLLVGLYESWRLPAAVILIVPIGALGAVMAVTLLGMPNDVYFKVGLVTIIGLAAKNAILIVEFARDLRAQGYRPVEAAIEAARLRFRPIVMTSMAFIMGVVPLTLATGAGAASQHAIGVGVIGGMLSATVLGVFFVPVFFVWVMGSDKASLPKA